MPRPDPEDRRARGAGSGGTRRSRTGGEGQPRGGSAARGGAGRSGADRGGGEYRPPRIGGGGGRDAGRPPARNGGGGGSKRGSSSGAGGGSSRGASSGSRTGGRFEREYRPPPVGERRDARPPARRARDDDRGRDERRGSSRAGTRSGGPERRPRRFEPNAEEARAPKAWGSLGRKGARQLREDGPGPASVAWREAVARSREDATGSSSPAATSEVWVLQPDVEPAPAPRSRRSAADRGDRADAGGRARRAGQRGRAAASAPTADDAPRGRKPRALPAEVASEVHVGVGGAKIAARVQQRLTDATGAYERERYADAARILKPLAEQAPGVAAVRELYGLALYRLGRWDAAIKELEAFRAVSDSVDQHPTLADCYRAKKRWKRVDELWEDLRRASPAPELLAEGRLVMAGSLADRGRVGEAIELLERARTDAKKPKDDHLRTWYALADLYERAGEVPRARELFRRILQFDRDLFDAAERLAAIG